MLSIVCALLADTWTNNVLLLATSAYGGSIGYYGALIGREMIHERRAAVVTVRALKVESGSAEVLDSVVFSPVLLYVCVALVFQRRAHRGAERDRTHDCVLCRRHRSARAPQRVRLVKMNFARRVIKTDPQIETMNDLIICTPRMILRPLHPEDARALHALWTAPGVRRFLWDGEIVPFAQTLATIEQSIVSFQQCGLGVWGAWAREGGALGGFAGFVPQHDPPVLELGYAIDPAQWGRGLATEVAGPIVKYGFDAGLTEITASLDTANTASARVLEKLGFVNERQAMIDGVELSFYRCTRTLFYT